MLRKLGVLLLLLPALPVVLLARLLRPVFRVRFGRLHSERIGHLSWNTEYYLSRRELDGARSLDLFCTGAEPANRPLVEMWSRHLTVSRLVWPLWKLNGILPGGEGNEVRMRFDSGVYADARDQLARTGARLRFTREEEERGRASLAALGVPKGAEFVCFHARDSAYLSSRDPSRDWSYHDFRDTSVGNFLPAARALAARGYPALRMGAVVKEPLPCDAPLIIDYAGRCRSEFLDLYLTAKCRFFIASNAGLVDLADVFRRPIVRTNACQLFGELPVSGAKDILIPKRWRSGRTGRLLTLREAARSPVWDARFGDVLAAEGIELVENTPEEIAAAALELDDRLRGTWSEAPGDAGRQERFWDVLREAGRWSGPRVTRIGADFLRRAPDFLD